MNLKHIIIYNYRIFKLFQLYLFFCYFKRNENTNVLYNTYVFFDANLRKQNLRSKISLIGTYKYLV